LALLAAAIAAAAGIALEVGSSSGWSLRGTVEQESFDSKALDGRLQFAVYLPPGYSSRRRYPVIYFLHGLPAAGGAFRAFGFVPSALEQSGLRAIVVAPQGARDGDSDPEYLDWGPGRNWESAIAEELPAYVDAHYRTIRGRAGRALIGLSAGGYGAFLLTLHHLPSFAVVESWSGYFHPTDPSGTKALRLGSSLATRGRARMGSSPTCARPSNTSRRCSPSTWARATRASGPRTSGSTGSSRGPGSRTCSASMRAAIHPSSGSARRRRGSRLQ